MTDTNYSVKKEANAVGGSKAEQTKSAKQSFASDNNNISQDKPVVNSNNMQNSEKNFMMFYDINLEVESVILPSAKTRQEYKMDSTSNDIVSQDDSAVNTNSMQNKEMYSVKRSESAVVEEDFFDEAGVVEEKNC